MKLVTIDVPPNGRAGAVIGAEIVDLGCAARATGIAPWLPESVRAILAGGVEALDGARRIVDAVAGGREGERERLREDGALRPIAAIRLLAPIPDPALLLSCGMNYGAHLKEMNTPVPKQPTAFIKLASSITGPGWPILVPPQCPDMIDFEGEFSFVLGRSCHNVSAAEAMECVAGYTIVNDVSARDWVAGFFVSEGRMEAMHSWELNILGKQLPSFSPMGPVLVTKDEVPDPHRLHLETRLNGRIMQDTNTDDLVFKIPALIEHYSRWYRFRAGDVVTTGSPSGVGFARNPKVFMKPGDTIAITVEGVGTLENPVRREN